MNPPNYSFWIAGGIFICCLTVDRPALAQISTDTTLPIQSNISKSGNVFQITGGTAVGRNLFHSFTEFSVPQDSTAYFNNDVKIENIISRITGSSPSSINGLLKANGDANLFLINPNGIVFGLNAQLDIGGSFLASTASAVNFADETQYSSTAPQPSALLTVSVPIGLQFGSVPGSIVNQSRTPDSSDQTVGLLVKSGRTLALLGGDVLLQGGNLTATVDPMTGEGGRIDLGSVAGNSLVSLTPTNQGWALGYETTQNFLDIQLSQGARVDASGAGGTINVQGRRVTLIDGSAIINQTIGEKPAGTLSVTALESVELIGTDNDDSPSSLLTQVSRSATGSGGNLIINTKQLIIRDGGAASAGTFGRGAGGNLEVNASELVELIGTRDYFPTVLTTSTLRTGVGGNLTINTKRLIVRDGAQVQAATFGEGRGGTLSVNASESVELMGTGIAEEIGTQFSSSLLATSGIEGLPFQPSGAGGNLKLSTGQLLVQDRAQISVSGKSTGPAGQLVINADSIQLDNRGSLTAETRANDSNNTDQGSIEIRSRDLVLTNNSNITTNATQAANGGNITIDTGVLALLENSSITANAVKGRGGNIQITTQGLFQSPDSKITASSEQGINGLVDVELTGIDPSQGLTQLPETVDDPSNRIAQGCSAGGGAVAVGQSKFIVTGRGGLPPSPGEGLTNSSALVDLGTPVPSPQTRATTAVAARPTSSSKQLVEAQGWIIGSDGRVILTAQSPEVTPYGPRQVSVSCQEH